MFSCLSFMRKSSRQGGIALKQDILYSYNTKTGYFLYIFTIICIMCKPYPFIQTFDFFETLLRVRCFENKKENGRGSKDGKLTVEKNNSDGKMEETIKMESNRKQQFRWKNGRGNEGGK